MRIRYSFYCLFLLLMLSLLTGCSLLPRSGPSNIDIMLFDPQQAHNHYRVFALDQPLVTQINQTPPLNLSALYGYQLNGRKVNGRKAKARGFARLGVGDRLVIQIWEASPDGLFSTTEKKHSVLEVAVDDEGKIFIPYVGRLVAAGKRIEQVRKQVEMGLVKKAIEPQVNVTLVNNVSNRVVVLGDVNKSTQLMIPDNGLRLSESIAQAGGITASTFDTEVTLVRGTKQHTMRLNSVLKEPDNDIYLMAKDTVIVNHNPKSFTAFGAVTKSNHIPFNRETLSLLEALAQVGGLNDRLADAGGVFLFRFEPQTLLEQISSSPFPSAYEPGFATIYRLDFNQPNAFFLASSVQLKDKDIIYVATSPIAEFNKFISMVVGPVLYQSKQLAD